MIRSLRKAASEGLIHFILPQHRFSCCCFTFSKTLFQGCLWKGESGRKREGGLHCYQRHWGFLYAIWTPASVKVWKKQRSRKKGLSINNSFGFSVSSYWQAWLSFSMRACLSKDHNLLYGATTPSGSGVSIAFALPLLYFSLLLSVLEHLLIWCFRELLIQLWSLAFWRNMVFTTASSQSLCYQWGWRLQCPGPETPE